MYFSQADDDGNDVSGEAEFGEKVQAKA